MDIGSIVSQRLTAIRKLQENPNDVQALTQMYKSNQEVICIFQKIDDVIDLQAKHTGVFQMQSWAQSKQQPGQFTGTTGAQVLSQAELSSGYQAWAKKVLITPPRPSSFLTPGRLEQIFRPGLDIETRCVPSPVGSRHRPFLAAAEMESVAARLDAPP